MNIHRILPGLPSLEEIQSVKRVAAYCRVSSWNAEQLSSYENQKKYYEEYIRAHANWELVKVYADIRSGRRNAKMQQFQNMMEDCRSGKIDLIIMKSISRMGRNTVEVLKLCQELKALGVEVYFEIHKIYLSNPSSDLFLTIMASLYQNESETLSYNIKFGIRHRFETGKSKFASKICYGYSKNDEGELVINDEEADVIRLIFRLRQNEYSLRQISRELLKREIPSPRGRSRWGPETLNKILNNEKYYGSVLLQKTYVPDSITAVQTKNHGQVAQYLITNNHEPIIDGMSEDELTEKILKICHKNSGIQKKR